MGVHMPGCQCLTFTKNFNSLPNDKLLDWTEFKEFADNK